jgi:hypothetical protein
MAILRGLRAATGAAVVCGVLAPVLIAAAAQARAKPCDVVEPDSLAISWMTPCDDGRWLLDPRSGCRLWDWHPAPEDTATWSGACPSGRKDGRGVVQWFEHGRPIDRFEGVYRRSKRYGFGRYDWPTGERFEGTYADDLPNGPGTVTIDGASFAGTWHGGCLAHSSKRIAIGVPIAACGGGPLAQSPRSTGRHDQ